MLVCQSGPSCLPFLAQFDCTIKVRILCACWIMALWESIPDSLHHGLSPSHSSGGIQSHSLIPSDLSLNLEMFYYLSYLQWSLISLFSPIFPAKAAQMQCLVDLVKCVVELPHTFLSLCKYKALLFAMPDSALDSMVGSVPFQPSVPSEVTAPEHHTVFNQSGPWPPSCKGGMALAASQQGSGCESGISAGWDRAQVR